MATITTAQKNEMVKANALSAIALPEGTIQFGDYSFAIPVTVEGEQRYAKVVLTSASNKDTKTTSAFDPMVAQADWLADKEFKANKVKADKAEREAKKNNKSKKSKPADEEIEG